MQTPAFDRASSSRAGLPTQHSTRVDSDCTTTAPLLISRASRRRDHAPRWQRRTKGAPSSPKNRHDPRHRSRLFSTTMIAQRIARTLPQAAPFSFRTSQKAAYRTGRRGRHRPVAVAASRGRVQLCCEPKRPAPAPPQSKCSPFSIRFSGSLSLIALPFGRDLQLC